MRFAVCLLSAFLLLWGAAGRAPGDVPADGPSGTVSVRDFGAQGDGVADDTEAFQKALDAAAARGGATAFVPAGRYLIKTHLVIPAGVTLKGVHEAPPFNDRHGSVLVALEGKGREDGPPFISMKRASTLKGLVVTYPEQSKDAPVAYPWSVRGLEENCSIIDVMLFNPWQAVDFGSITGVRHTIRGLYGQPIRRGIYVDRCYDVGRISDVHFWPFWTLYEPERPVNRLTKTQGEAFIFGRADWEYVNNCFAIWYHVGFRFQRSADKGPFGGGGNYLLTQSGIDGSEYAALVEETQSHAGISFLNAQLFGDVVVRPTNQGMVRFTGCGFFGSVDGKRGSAMMRLAGRGRVSFSNCSFYCLDPMNAGKRMIVCESGRVGFEGCQFLPSEFLPVNPIPLVLERGVVSATIVGNEFNGAGRIVNRSKGQVRIVGNTFDTERAYLAQVEGRGALSLEDIAPGTERTTLVPNGDFRSGAAGWLAVGDIAVGPAVAAVPGRGRPAVALARPGQHNGPHAVLHRQVNLKPNTDYVLSAYIWNLRTAREWVGAHVDVGPTTPGELRLSVGPGSDRGARGFFVYGRFNTGRTGRDVTVRVFYDGPTRYASPRTVAAQWTNVAVTEASRFRLPAARAKRAPARKAR